MLPSSLPKLLAQQLTFLVEVDRLKTILRKKKILAEDQLWEAAQTLIAKAIHKNYFPAI